VSPFIAGVLSANRNSHKHIDEQLRAYPAFFMPVFSAWRAERRSHDFARPQLCSGMAGSRPSIGKFAAFIGARSAG